MIYSWLRSFKHASSWCWLLNLVSHLVLWGGGGEDAALLDRGWEVGEDTEEEEAGWGEVLLHPSDNTWTLSDKHTVQHKSGVCVDTVCNLKSSS